jgi:hypothetical protein
LAERSPWGRGLRFRPPGVRGCGRVFKAKHGSLLCACEGAGWDKKVGFCKNEPEKLLKTKVRPFKMGQNEPENEAEKLLKTGACGKNEPEKT